MTENAITAPASHIPPFISVQTAAQTLPFNELRWENFEKLCYRLAGKQADIESHSLYGRAGQAQQGIDIYARKRNGRYETWQAKCYAKYTHANLKDACVTFLAGSWSSRTDIFYIAVQCAVDDVGLQNAIEEQAELFRAQGITLKVLGGHDLCTVLRNNPDIVLEFFGRECARAFFGDTVSQELLLRLDGSELDKIRTQLHRAYQGGFELLDRIPVSAPTPFSDRPQASISLLDRFSTPDVLLRETVVSQAASSQSEDSTSPMSNPQRADARSPVKKEESRQAENYRRTPILEWLAGADQIAIVGHAGSGKSTVLRCLALDLLGDQGRFTDVAKRWGRHLPLFISFAKWVRLSEASRGTVGIKELIRATWQPQLTSDLVALIDQAIDESRVVLLVDGLDEWANEQAARTTLLAMLTIVAAHKIPVVVSARPGGLSKIGGIPDNWAVGLLAPLSKVQQREIATTWFSRNVGFNNDQPSHEESIAWQTQRFFNELDKGRGLATLAETPLLLLGLIALAVRQLVLPINKVQALSQLTDLLLEIHPSSRATAAGDVSPRFSPAASIDVRREALAALAFEIRVEGGDAGYPLQLARNCIKTFLTDPEGYSYTAREASEVANEILAVNAETMGLLVEKGREEVGFVHASLEEYLASVHIHGWPIEKILGFVRANASSFRWRSVFGDLIARNTRRSEAEQIVQVIDEPEADVIGALQRRLLLADVVFSGAEINRPTAIRLAERSLDIIEGAGWGGERSAHLAVALGGIYNPTLREKSSESINRWGIRTKEYLKDFYSTLTQWEQSEHQLSLLKHGLKDDNPANSRAAAQSLGLVYKGNFEVESWLMTLIRGDSDLAVVARTLEALTIGWPNNPNLIEFLATASAATEKALQLSAIWCKVQLRLHQEVDLSALLSMSAWHDRVSYEHHAQIGESLVQGWLDKDRLIDICLGTLNGGFGAYGEIEKEIARYYILSCSAKNRKICAWIVNELQSEHPYVLRMGEDWSQLLKFAEMDGEIRELLVLAVTSKRIEHQEYVARPVYDGIQDPRITRYLIERTKTAEGFSVVWLLAPLISGWAAELPEVRDLIQEVLKWPDERKVNLVGLYPQIYSHEACIEALLKILNSGHKVRFDIITSAFRQLNISNHKEIKDILVSRGLREPDQMYSGLGPLVALYPQDSRVKNFALERLKERNPPLGLFASVYRDDLVVQKLIAQRIGALSAIMRLQIIDAASSEFDRNDAAKEILERYDHEVDGPLKVHAAIKNYQALLSVGTERKHVVDRLLKDAMAVGHDHDDRRAAAFAGLVVYGATEQFSTLEWGKKPLDISLGHYSNEPPALIRLVAEHWGDLEKSFDGKFLSRLGHFTDESRFWELVAPHVSFSSDLRQRFLDYCLRTTEFHKVAVLQALAKEVPRSDLLLRQCLKAVKIHRDDKDRSWNRLQSYYEASYILRHQFPQNVNILAQLQSIAFESNFKSGIAALAIYAPHNQSLNEVVSALTYDDRDDHSFVTPIIIGTERLEGEKLEKLVSAMVNRPRHSLWSFQDRINYAIKFRISTDSEFSGLISERLRSSSSASEISSYSRYLASTGKLNEESHAYCLSLLNSGYSSLRIPPHGYDSTADAVRPVAHSLLDVLAGPNY
ncbi:NACHT domain-containing protein [Pseudomonas sp. 5P_5.1_Bac1]|uniref:NACHT domain-containing protein n=1 Tax=Pseudomonas sp. 5P_5.1_Bac1 TaxID=2971616 RepID=UPI0021C8F992|nr:NACHT domain-containing protein [Pseudomonas sp. 5P_5.1_Bac1]MCU1720920.1 NACHT domain-containing protein [Pseudomonas sp. 5P_5.1_Bac1]